MILLVIKITLGVSAALINTAILIAYLVQKVRRPFRVSPAGLMVLNLLCADILFSVYIVSDLVIASTISEMKPSLCSVFVGLAYLTLCGSYTALISVTVDRFIATRHALKYRVSITRRRALMMVCTGWLLSVAGLAGALASFDDTDWRPGLTHCSEIHSFKVFMRYVFVPLHVVANLCVLVIQICICWILRRQDATVVRESPLMLSKKSSKLLYCVIIPLSILTLCYDVVLLVMLVWLNKTIFFLYRMTVVFVEIWFLLNIFLYSLATASIRNPICHLYADFQRWARKSSAMSATPVPQIGSSNSQRSIA